MLKILINSYTCCPGMGSEQGMGWNWIVSLAKHCELFVITEGEYRSQIEQWMREEANAPLARNMYFYWNPVTPEVRKMCWNQGDWRFYKYYREWQWKTYLMAKEICEKEKIDALHQLNMIGFREPGYLWKLSKETGIPFVWGPVDAKESFPVSYLENTSMKTKLFINLKNAITCFQLRYGSRVHKAAKQALCVLAASSNSQLSFRKYFQMEALLMNETGCYVQEHAVVDKTNKEALDVLWVGKLDFRKQLHLALKSISEAKNSRLKLHIVGGGNILPYQELAKDLNIEQQCKWYGAVTHQKVQEIMQACDVFLFTSVAEGTPHVVLEAIGNNLPVLCFNTCGQGDSVNHEVGCKVELSNPKQSIRDFAAQLNELEGNRQLLKEMALNCKERQEELSWENKALQMVEYYNKIL